MTLVTLHQHLWPEAPLGRCRLSVLPESPDRQCFSVWVITDSRCGCEAGCVQGIVGLAASVLISAEWGTGLLHLLGEEANLSLDLMNIFTVSGPLPGVSRAR